MALSAIGNAPPQDERTPQLCPSAEIKNRRFIALNYVSGRMISLHTMSSCLFELCHTDSSVIRSGTCSDPEMMRMIVWGVGGYSLKNLNFVCNARRCLTFCVVNRFVPVPGARD